MLLLLLNASPALLSDLGPAAACRLVLSRAGRCAVIDDALVGQLAAAQEFFGEVTRVESVACGVDRLRDELGISGKTQERRDKVLSCCGVSEWSIAL